MSQNRAALQGVEGGDEGVGVEDLVGDQSARRDCFDQRFGTSEIVILADAEHHLDGIAEGIDERVNFGRQSAAGSADGLRTPSLARHSDDRGPNLPTCDRHHSEEAHDVLC